MPRTSKWDPPTTPFTYENVARRGVTRRMITTASRTGRITRLVRGVYVATSAVPEDPVARHLQQAQAIQLVRPRAVASHHTAALAWDLDLDRHAAALRPPAFILPTGPTARSEVGHDREIAVRRLPREHRVELPSGLLVTTQARTAVDVAATLQLPEALITLDSAAREILLERLGTRRIRDSYRDEHLLNALLGEFLETVEIAATQFSRPSLERVVPLLDPRRESPLESVSYGEMVVAGFPLPELQVRIATPNGDVYPDFLWRNERVIGEADGMGKYAAREDVVREKTRQELLEQLGFRVVRWTWDEIRRRPAAVLARIAAALDAGRC